jgi:CheY-like chemotaxis protein
MLNGDAHLSFEGELSLRIRPVALFSKNRTRRNISQMPLAILYAEDHATIRLAFKETLEREGFYVEACADGPTALARLESETGYALLLFDDELPGMSGLELARHARSLEHRRSAPVVIVSASEVEAEALASGADLFLKKPQDLSRLTGEVARLLR